MAATQTSIKPDRKAGQQVAGIVAIQLKEYSSLPTKGIISTPMGLCFPRVGQGNLLTSGQQK
jgi:hypothetical protein